MSRTNWIQIIEELSMNALPALQTNMYDGWVLRFADGYTNRANSVNPIYSSYQEVANKISTIEQTYRNRNLKPIFKMTKQALPENLDENLAKNGYIQAGLTAVQVLPLEDVNIAVVHKAEFYQTFEEHWFNYYCHLNHISGSNQVTLAKMLKNIVVKTAYFLLKNDSGEILACGMCVLERGYIGLFDIVTASNCRNKGYGTVLIQNILDWGKDNGAQYAYLQVMLNNEPALKLYSKIGFKEVYQYWYRSKD
ncbi:GNAT family N-acetyltransferase [Niallia sp. BSM11]|uniref:GNAT family N-acetyltransferase n=1 Tax=Niallia sp. BSM11 TaxID=3391576 RepID=UPI003984A52D